MLKQFFPKQPDFFEQLSKIAEIGLSSAKKLNELSSDAPDVESIAKSIYDLEHEADVFFRSSLQTLTDTFITPIEREHLHSLFVTIDDVVDMVHAVAQCAQSYRIKTLSAGTREMLALTLTGVAQLQELILHVDEIKEPVELHRVSKEISRTGNKVEAKMRQTLQTLYDSNTPLPLLLKERDLILMIQNIMTSAEKVTTLMESILLDQA